MGGTWGLRGRRVQDGSPGFEGYGGTRRKACLGEREGICWVLAAWEACLLLQNTLASGPLLSPVWHLHHRNPLETLAVALMWGKRGVTLPSHLSVHLSVHPSSICSPDMTCVSNLSQTQPMDSAGSKHSADFLPPGALTSVTDSPTSPSNFAPSQVSDSQVPPSVKYGSDCLPVPRELSPP